MGVVEIIADAPLMLQELCGDDCADRVAPQVLWPGVTATISIEPRDGIEATRFKLAAENVALAHPVIIP